MPKFDVFGKYTEKNLPLLFEIIYLTNSDKSTKFQVQTLGQSLRVLRVKNHLLLRQVAATLKIDTALLSKIERNERSPSKEQVVAFAKYYKVNSEKLLIEWLSDKLANEVQNENIGLKAIQIAEKKVKLHNKK